MKAVARAFLQGWIPDLWNQSPPLSGSQSFPFWQVLLESEEVFVITLSSAD